jgi:hypothetical protein
MHLLCQQSTGKPSRSAKQFTECLKLGNEFIAYKTRTVYVLVKYVI